MTDENEYGIFAEMHLEEIIEFIEGEGYLIRVFPSSRKDRWIACIKHMRPSGMPRKEYRELDDAGRWNHTDLMTAAREAACFAYYGEPEIDLGVRDED